MISPRVYLASPLGFSAPGTLWCEQILLPTVDAAGLVAVEPFTHNPAGPQLHTALALPEGPQRTHALRTANAAIGHGNIELIDSCTLLLAVLDGTDVDSGTAAEIGYASARGLRCVGLRTDVRDSGDNAGALVNLQVEVFITRTGGGLHTTLHDAIADLLS